MLTAQGYERLERGGYLAEFGAIFFVAVMQVAKGAGRVNEVARIDAHFLHQRGGGKSGARIKMNVGHQRHLAALLAQRVAQHAHAFGFTHALCREPHQLGTGLRQLQALFGAAFHIVGVGVGHRLDAHRRVTSYGQLAHMHGQRGAAAIVKHTCHNQAL